MIDKGAFPHHMLKEIFEQPQSLRDTIAPRVSFDEGLIRLDDVRITADELRSLQRINIVASGTSRHAGMVGQFMIQDLANVPVDVDYASEFEYRNPLICRNELTIVITQSGETADTTAAQREAKAEWAREVERMKLIRMPDPDDVIFDFRTMAERVNARLKDEFGARFVRVRGAIKVKCHLMFGVVALAVDQILRVADSRPAPA